MSTQRPRTAEQRVRDLRKELTTLQAEPPGQQRAVRLAELARIAHDDRLLNLAMTAATQCLDDDPQAPEVLVAAYRDADGDDEERLARLTDLRDLAGYLDRPDVRDAAADLLVERARTWVADADASERRYRLRTVESLASREVADTIRDTLERAP